MQPVLRPDIRPHANDEDVSEARDCRYHPDKDSLNDAGQEVLERGDPIRVWFTAANMWCVPTVLEFLKISDERSESTRRLHT